MIYNKSPNSFSGKFFSNYHTRVRVIRFANLHPHVELIRVRTITHGLAGDEDAILQNCVHLASTPKVGVQTALASVRSARPGVRSLTFRLVGIARNGTHTSKVQVLANTTFGADFASDTDGTAYVGGDNTRYRVALDGSVTIIAGGLNDLTLEGATSAQFERTSVDNGVLYTGTNGGLLAPVDGQVHGRQLLAINTNIFGCSYSNLPLASLVRLLDFLFINDTLVFAHDKERSAAMLRTAWQKLVQDIAVKEG